MEENTTVLEQAAPQAEANTPAEQAENEDAVQTETPANEATTPSGEAQEDSAPSDEIAYKFNHETFKVARDKAPALIQSLMKKNRDYEKKYVAAMDRVRYLAEARGQSTDEFLEWLEDSADKSEYRHLLENAGGNEEIAKRLHELSKNERKAKFKSAAALDEERAKQEKDDATKRMSEQFSDLLEEFPEISKFEDIPADVVESAVENEISLYDAYLRYLRRSEKQAAAQKAKQQKAAAASAGAMKSAPEQQNKEDAASAAFRAAFRD